MLFSFLLSAKPSSQRGFMGILKKPHFQDLYWNLHSNFSEVCISTINTSGNARILLVKLWSKKPTLWLKRAQFALQDISRKSIYKISFENLLSCEMWFTLQQRNWQLDGTASAGHVINHLESTRHFTSMSFLNKQEPDIRPAHHSRVGTNVWYLFF